MGRDTRRDQDPDDWFAEPDTSAVTRRSDVAAPTDAPEEDAADEDWLRQPDDGPRVRTGALPATTKLAIAATVLIAALVLGLLLAGVFESGTSRPTSPTTTPHTTTRPATPTTTAQTSVPVPTTPLAPGDTGPAVTELQRALARAGFPVGTIDGHYGPATKNAVAQFQASVHLTPDGIAGPQTLTALNRKLNGP